MNRLMLFGRRADAAHRSGAVLAGETLIAAWWRASRLSVVFWLCASHGALAATVPGGEAQEFLRGQERDRALHKDLVQQPDVRLPIPSVVGGPAYLPLGEAPCFPIHTLRLTGESAEEFDFSLKPLTQGSNSVLGQCLGANGISWVLSRVQNAIVARGFVTTRVLAAPQDLKPGELVFSVIPGKVRQIRWAEGTDSRATWTNALPLRPGDILNSRDLEQALENFKRVPTAEVDIQITPAEGLDAKPGDSDLVIGWKQAFPFRLSVSADDSGTRATGKYQGGATLSYDHALTLNDLFYVSFNRDLGGGDPGQRGTRGYAAHYSVPFGYWLLGFTTSRHRYHQAVAGASQTFLYSGESRNSDIKLSRLIYRDAVRKTTLSLRGWTRTSNNFIDDTEVEVQRRRMAGWDLGLGHREFIGSATLDLNLNYRRGTGAMNALAAPEEAFGEGTSRPTFVTSDAQLNIPFAVGAQRLHYSGTWRGQFNRTPLTPQDRFAIGGRYTVRGFDGESSLSAERGWLIRNELSAPLADSGQTFYVGLDHGQVGGPSSELLLGKQLTGAVLGLRGGIKNVRYDLFAGRPVRKPDGFKTAASTVGFSLNVSF